MANGHARVEKEEVPDAVENILQLHANERVEVKLVPQKGGEYEIKWTGV